MAKAYVPDRGDIVWLQFDPQAGHEQAGRRPAFVVSPLAYNRKVGLALVWGLLKVELPTSSMAAVVVCHACLDAWMRVSRARWGVR